MCLSLKMEVNNTFLKMRRSRSIVIPFLTLSLVLTMLIGSTILPFQTLNAQVVVIGGPNTDQVSGRIVGTLLYLDFLTSIISQ